MLKKIQSYDDFKRVIYLSILPFVLTATTVSLIVQVIKQTYTFGFYVNIMFDVAFLIGWVLAFQKRHLKFFECFILFLVISYYLGTVTIEILESVGAHEERTLGHFIIWTPLMIMFVFVIMKKRKALLISILVLFLSMIPGVMMYGQLNAYFVDSLIQLYVSAAVYIIIVFFTHGLFQVHAEMKVVRRQLNLDSLTQIGNRHQIDEWMNTLIGEAREEGSFSILFFDVDRFKCVNDRFGHKTGDDVLKEMVRIVQDEMRKEEFFGRWGGEEFIIFLQTPERKAYQVAERLRQVIEQHDFGEVGQVTVSFGVTGFLQGDTAETILVRVDEMLYASKENGRNRVTRKMMP